MGKIDLSKLKDLMKGLGGLRVYLVLIWPAVILLACGVVLTAAWLMGSSLKQKAARESVPIGNQVKEMLKKLPAAGQAEVERQYQDAYQRDANLIKLLSVESTQRELLSYDIFPKPKDTSTLLFTRFGAKFCEGIEGLIAKDRGGDCPGAEELKVARQTAPRFSRLSGAGGASASSRIIEEICYSRAKSVSLYAAPETVCGYDFWKSYQYSNIDDSVKDCWFWQIGYWIIEDVFSTAGTMNAGSSNVLTSPVKRVERVGFVAPDTLLNAGSGKASQERPKYVTKPDEQLTESFTGRMSNENIDVVHFGMVVVLSSKAVIPFMRELCSAKEHKFTGFTGQEPAKEFKHNQITILESRVRPVDLMSADHVYYRYGADSVVEVELVCEYIFNKAGYDAIKPESVKPIMAKTDI
jgi:hypothetical protein